MGCLSVFSQKLGPLFLVGSQGRNEYHHTLHAFLGKESLIRSLQGIAGLPKLFLDPF